MSTAQNLREERLKKLEKIREIGWNPYPSSFDKKQMINVTKEMEGKEVKTAGKLFSFRTHGNIAFADLKDETGKIQLFFKRDVLGDEVYKHLSLLDVGDYVGVEGTVLKTTAGEISIVPTKYTFLSKSLQQLPHEWFGLKDTEQRFRQRYLDLLLNPDVRERFNTRTRLLRHMREYLDGLGFWEVETPIFHPQYGGANAKPFTTHYNALGQDMYLRIAFELYLKRLISGGYERVYEIGRDFRNEGFDRSHSPEFTMIEWYEAYADYHRVMDVTEGLFKHLAQKLNGSSKMKIDEKEIDLSGKWPRITMNDIMKKELGIEVETASQESLLAYCTEHSIGLIGGETKGQIIFAIFEHSIPEKLIEPIWIIDYPEDVSPLSKNHRSKPGWVERFEGYIGGKEICDGWSELTDPIIQRQRFENDQKASRKDKSEAQQVDEDFLTSMEFGMPPMGGIGIGIERLVMFFTNTWAIREVMLFPTLKIEKKVKPHVTLPTLKKNAPLTIDSEVKKAFPSIQVGVAIIRNISIKKEDKKLQSLIQGLVEELQNQNPESLKDSKEILSYRKLYKEMGIDWHSRRPSPEALLRRIMQKKGLYTINTCVDAANVVVLNNKISVGVFDLDKIQSPTHLRFGKQGDTILLLGNEESTPIGEKELTYVDKMGPYNLDFNYRDTQRTAVSEDTKNLLINVDGVYDIDRKLVEKTLQELVEIIREYCGGEIELIGIVDEANEPLKKTSNEMSEVKEPYSISRETAFALVQEKLSSPHLVKHSIAVEAAMKGLARHFGGNESRWGMVGLLHDIDWDVTKDAHDRHTVQTVEWLKEIGNTDTELHTAILSHNHHHNGEGEPSTQMEWALYTCDELTGFIVARTLVLPTKKLADVTPESVIKKFPSKSFAAGVNRLQIQMCEEKLGIKLIDFVGIVLKSMQEIASDLSL